DCWWCHNPESRCPEAEPGAGDGKSLNGGRIDCTVTLDHVMTEILKDAIFYDESGGGVTFSGGEPMMQIDFLAALLESCRERGIRTAIDTCGYAPPEDFDRIDGLADLILFDLKVMDDDLHRKYTGVSNELILANLTRLAGRGVRIVVRIPLIPGVTDTRENLEAVAAFLKPLKTVRKITLLPYNKLGEDKARRYRLDRREVAWETQSPDEIQKHAAWLEEQGYIVTTGG
ncbi:MAG TPA: glycyl-radical enzyme activating protein, partial [Acidobacteriota bacterium]|nr:glycyl-radical enzyme activating protein [Acidobacteriota bacterium]